MKVMVVLRMMVVEVVAKVLAMLVMAVELFVRAGYFLLKVVDNDGSGGEGGGVLVVMVVLLLVVMNDFGGSSDRSSSGDGGVDGVGQWW